MSLTGKEWIRFLLTNFRTARTVSGGQEVLMRCLYCPDSKDPTHAHMYFSIPKNSTEPLKFNCRKCHTGGYVTANRLMSWNIYDPDILVKVNEYNKNPKLLQKLITNAAVYNLKIPTPLDTTLNRRKLDYINQRLGTSLTFEETASERIILSLSEFLNYNRIIDYTRHINIMDQLDDNFLGFLSYDCAFVNMRNCGFQEVYKTISDRYVNYNIFQKEDNTMKYYVMPTHLDTLHHIRVNITEGPFDILSVHHNLRDNPHELDISVTGSGYFAALEFIFVYLKLIDVEIHIYKDNDMDWSFMDKISTFLSPYGVEFYVHSNIFPGEKDMGVSKEKIQETVQRLL